MKYVPVEQLLPVNPAGHDWFASETINSTDVIEKPGTSEWRCLWQQHTNEESLYVIPSKMDSSKFFSVAINGN